MPAAACPAAADGPSRRARFALGSPPSSAAAVASAAAAWWPAAASSPALTHTRSQQGLAHTASLMTPSD